ncbi:MAG: Co2+/Mg2+ efflux protein ApaG [Panacagrimonas sp.]
MSNTLTNGIRVIAQPQYVPAQSEPSQGRYLFAYQITISNEGAATVQLLSRYWAITNGEGRLEEVRGPGVVGQQPVLKPGESFQYTSACPLDTPVGTMHGAFNMVVQQTGENFSVDISPFRLAVPSALN